MVFCPFSVGTIFLFSIIVRVWKIALTILSFHKLLIKITSDAKQSFYNIKRHDDDDDDHDDQERSCISSPRRMRRSSCRMYNVSWWIILAKAFDVALSAVVTTTKFYDEHELADAFAYFFCVRNNESTRPARTVTHLPSKKKKTRPSKVWQADDTFGKHSAPAPLFYGLYLITRNYYQAPFSSGQRRESIDWTTAADRRSICCRTRVDHGIGNLSLRRTADSFDKGPASDGLAVHSDCMGSLHDERSVGRVYDPTRISLVVHHVLLRCIK